MDERLDLLRSAMPFKVEVPNIATMNLRELVSLVYPNLVSKRRRASKAKKVATISNIPSQPIFEELTPYVMVVMVYLDEQIILATLFATIPLSADKKDGSIYSVQYGPYKRYPNGSISSNNPYLPNQVTLEMYLQGEWLSLRVFRNKVEVIRCIKIEWIPTLTRYFIGYISALVASGRMVCTGPLIDITYDLEMCNYSFSLGFYVDREKLGDLINQSNTPFSARLATSKYAGLHIKYPMSCKPRKKKTPKFHHIKVFYKGSCLYSTKSYYSPESKMVFSEFMCLINKYKQDIQLR